MILLPKRCILYRLVLIIVISGPDEALFCLTQDEADGCCARQSPAKDFKKMTESPKNLVRGECIEKVIDPARPKGSDLLLNSFL